MRKLFSLLLCSILLLTGCPKYGHKISLQQRAAHGLIFKTVDSQGVVQDVDKCSGTAVGQHAILTAEHCVYTFPKIVTIDLSVKKHRILAAEYDGRDHVILIISGQPFHDYIDLTYNVRHAIVPGEKVYIYGVGGDAYPPRYLSGRQVPDYDAASEVDQADGIQEFTIPIVQGDSGAAIFGRDGKIVAINTYGDSDVADGFELNFDPAVMYGAVHVAADQVIP